MNTRHNNFSGAMAGPRARAFTLMELLIGILIIAVLAGLLIVSARSAIRTTKGAADTQTLSAIRLAVEKFRQDFGFVPPLVKDQGDPRLGISDPITKAFRPVVYQPSVTEDALFLRTRPTGTDPDMRYSQYSLAYYLVGALDARSDGVDGQGFRTPVADGTFRLADRTVNQAMIDLGKSSLSLYADVEAKTNGRYEVRDRRNAAIRYYRWLSGREVPAGSNTFVVEKVDDLNVPSILGDAAESAKLRDASFAILAAGADGVFGDEPLAEILSKLALPNSTPEATARQRARSDNVVEVGK